MHRHFLKSSTTFFFFFYYEPLRLLLRCMHLNFTYINIHWVKRLPYGRNKCLFLSYYWSRESIAFTEIGLAVIAFWYHLFFFLFFHLAYVRFWAVIFPEAVSVSDRWVEQVMKRKERKKGLSLESFKVKRYKPSAKKRL